MLNKVKIRLLFFCALATGVILLVMTTLCLAILEKGTQEKSYLDFQNNAKSILNSIERQTVLSHIWLSQMENNYHFIFDIRDGDTPLLYTAARHTAFRDTFALARKTAQETYHLDFENSYALSRYESFPLTMPNGSVYYVMAAVMPKNSGRISMIMLYPLAALQQQILQNRLTFGCGSAAAWLLLLVLAQVLIGNMLHPIEENRKNQSQFIASASHELRSPLAVILSALSAARVARDDERIPFLNTIQSEGERMARLVDDMLTLARSDSRSWSMDPQWTEPDTLLLEAYEKYELPAKQRNLHLKIRLPEAPVKPCFCDRQRIAQVLCILIDNAFSYTPAGGNVTLSLAENGKYIEFTVTDNGAGIAEEEREKIFDRFYRADRSHQDKEHFGLGLCIAREIVTLHKGKIFASGANGGGAVFTVRLPRP